MRQSIFPPSSISQVISLLEEIDQKSFLALQTTISSRRSFSPSEKSIKILSVESGIPENTLTYLIAALAFIYERLPNNKIDIDLRRNAIEEVVTDLGLFDEDERRKNSLIHRLDLLLAFNSNHERFKKNRRLESGFLPNIVEVNSFVDIRPSFDSERSVIDGYVPLIQLNFITDSDDPSINSLTFQLTQRSLDMLKEKIEDVEKKLRAVRSQGAFSTLLLDEGDE